MRTRHPSSAMTGTNRNQLECYGLLPDSQNEECRGCDARQSCRKLQRQHLQDRLREDKRRPYVKHRPRTQVRGLDDPTFQECVDRYGYTVGVGEGVVSFWYQGVRFLQKDPSGNWWILWPVRRKVWFHDAEDIREIFRYLKELKDHGRV